MRFEKKVALVTGGGSGIGQAVAESFAREGAKVAVLDRDATAAEQTVDRIRSSGGTALAVVADVTREEDVQEAVARTIREFGQIDVLHNHAGILPATDASILDVTAETIDLALSVNIKGMMLVGKHVARAMRDRGQGGTIVNTASDLSLIALPGICCYVTSKTAIPGLTRSMAVDLAAHQIRVNAVAPGFTYTGMTAGMADNAALMDPMRETYLLKQLGQPRDVASCVLFLASDESRYMTGAVLVVDGGHVVQ